MCKKLELFSEERDSSSECLFLYFIMMYFTPTAAAQAGGVNREIRCK